MEFEAKTQENNENMDSSTVYEVSYLFLPSLAMEQVPGEVSKLKDVIAQAGGSIISDENPILIDLAYPMVKTIQTTHLRATSGYFGWVKFELSKDSISAVKKFLDNNVNVLRFLIIKTVRENTLLNGKMKLKSEERTRKEEEVSEEATEAPKEVAPEELDKSIDDLVIA